MASIEKKNNSQAIQQSGEQEMALVIILVESPSGKTVKVEAAPGDCILEIRQFLLDTPATCDLTCYRLSHNGTILNDYGEIHHYPAIIQSKKPATLKMVNDFYDDRTARIHVHRVREILKKPPCYMSHLSPYLQGAMGSINPMISKKGKKYGKNNSVKEEKPNETLIFSLTNFPHDDNNDVIQTTVKKINFSAWNPPPGNRQLCGDLFYLEVITLENNVLHVTASVDGFYLNRSTVTSFDPTENTPSYKTFSFLSFLKQASPEFSKRFNSMLNRKMHSHPFESISAPVPVTSWFEKEKKHVPDWNRAEDALLDTYGMDSRGVLRDWNEEFQNCRELPKQTTQQRIGRDRTITRVYTDFVDAATKGACAVVEGNVPPINPMDPKRSYVFIYNNIFFSYAIDGRNVYKDMGGDLVSAGIANHDIKGIAQFLQADIDKLFCLATIGIDYRGQRLIAQSIIPGIFHGERASKHVYGSMDQGETINFQPEFHESVRKIAEQFHIEEHKIHDKENKEYSLFTCVETKGIRGSDGRYYILDLVRMTPRDGNYPNFKTHLTALLRPELIAIYTRDKAFQQLKKENTEKKVSDNKAKNDLEAKFKKIITEIRFNVDIFTPTKLACSEEKIKADTERIQDASSFLTKLIIPKFIASNEKLEIPPPVDGKHLVEILHTKGINVRYLGTICDQLKKTKLKNLERLCLQEMIMRAAKELLSGILREVKPDKRAERSHWYLAPAISKFLSSMLGSHCGGHDIHDDNLKAAESIVDFLDARDQKALDKLKEEEAILLQEQIDLDAARYQQKKIEPPTEKTLNGKSKDIEQEDTQQKEEKKNENDTKENSKTKKEKKTIDSDNDQNKKSSRNKKKSRAKRKKEKEIERGPWLRLPRGRRAPVSRLAPANLWQSIRKTVSKKFQYSLPLRLTITAREKISILRSLCMKVGIQLRCRDYDLDKSGPANPFVAEDIIRMFPVVKTHHCRNRDASDLMAKGKQMLNQRLLRPAYQCLLQASNILNQVYGPMHEQSAFCYRTFAMVCYHVGEFSQAVEYQQRAVVIMERVLGKDHNATAHGHSSLALYLHSIGQYNDALKHIKRALFLFELIAGPFHLDTTNTHMNVGMIYIDIGKVPTAMKHLSEALIRNRTIFGPDDLQVAVSHHHMAVGYSLLGLFRKALAHEKKAKDIFVGKLGPKHKRVKMCIYWMKQLTQGAVSVEKKDKTPLPAGMATLSPLSWASSRFTTPFKGRLTMEDVMELLQVTDEKELQAKLAKRTPKLNEASSSKKTNKTEDKSPELIKEQTEKSVTKNKRKKKKKGN